MGQESEAHLLSAYGGDAEIGAISAAIHEKHPFTLNFPYGGCKTVSLGWTLRATGETSPSRAVSSRCVTWLPSHSRYTQMEQQGRPTCSTTNERSRGQRWSASLACRRIHAGAQRSWTLSNEKRRSRRSKGSGASRWLSTPRVRACWKLSRAVLGGRSFAFLK